MRRPTLALLATATLLAACSSDDNTATPTTEPPPSTTAPVPTTTTAAPGYQASITRTEYGIPHIVADDWGSLGFGQGYAFAQDRACTLLDQIVKVRGERSMWFGAGDGDENLHSDLAYRHLHLWDGADDLFADQPDEILEMATGYAAGCNAELAEEGPHGWCEGADWVQPITTTDLCANMRDILLFASSGVLIDQIATAEPPAPAEAGPTDTATLDSTAAAGVTAMPDLTGTAADALGSNGWAIGSALSEGGGGMLLANPHFPWEGEKRLWENQLTLTNGELNVYGVTLTGTPGVLIGFNDAVAWTHTVSAGHRMTLYELDLAAGDPTTYVYGDETRAMEGEDVSVDVLQPDGSIETVTRTMWSSHYGPMLDLPFGWTTEKAYTLRDANIDNNDFIGQFLDMDRATGMDEFIEAHRTWNGIPWVNTMATSADGRAWYADTAATPNLSPDAIAGWQAAVAAGGTASLVLGSGAILLNGSDPANEWVDDSSAARPGILPFDQQPQLERDDFVFNANDSHWLANPAAPLTGYSPMTGPENSAQSARTRMNALLLTDPSVRGDDGLMSLADLQGAWLSNRALHAEIARDQVVKLCDDQGVVLVQDKPFDITPACDVLRDWDGRLNPDSTGAVLWREFLAQFSGADLTQGGGVFYTVPFDAADPINTPNTVADNTTVVNALAQAILVLGERGWPLDIALGDVQFDGRTVTDPLGLPGGTNREGAISIVSCCSGANTLGPLGDRDQPGYPVTFGNSFVMTLEFGADGPHAEAVLTYGQPDDPENPDFTAQMALFAGKEFRPIRFTPGDVEANAAGATQVVTGERAG